MSTRELDPARARGGLDVRRRQWRRRVRHLTANMAVTRMVGNALDSHQRMRDPGLARPWRRPGCAERNTVLAAPAANWRAFQGWRSVAAGQPPAQAMGTCAAEPARHGSRRHDAVGGMIAGIDVGAVAGVLGGAAFSPAPSNGAVARTDAYQLSPMAPGPVRPFVRGGGYAATTCRRRVISFAGRTKPPSARPRATGCRRGPRPAMAWSRDTRTERGGRV